MSDSDFDDLVDAVWRRNRASVVQRLTVLAATAEMLAQGTQGAGVARVDVDSALLAAHNLTGSLGAFGFPWASEVAAGIERLLRAHAGANGAVDPTDGARLTHLVSRLREMLPLDEP